jgi:hypothetical protein
VLVGKSNSQNNQYTDPDNSLSALGLTLRHYLLQTTRQPSHTLRAL